MKKKDNGSQRTYYNSIADGYELHYGRPEALEYRKKLYEKILGKSRADGLSALDIMCGGGQSTAVLMGKGYDFSGLDISDEQCNFYKKKFPQSNVYRRSIFDTGLKSEQFDLIVTDSLHHLHPDVNKGILEIIRLLKPGGLLLIWEPSSGSVFDFLRKAWYKLDQKYFEDNESSIDIHRIQSKHNGILGLKRVIYGGNIAYLLVNTSMIMRIKTKYIPFISKIFTPIENFLNIFQTKITSIYVIALFEKK